MTVSQNVAALGAIVAIQGGGAGPKAELLSRYSGVISAELDFLAVTAGPTTTKIIGDEGVVREALSSAQDCVDFDCEDNFQSAMQARAELIRAACRIDFQQSEPQQ